MNKTPLWASLLALALVPAALAAPGDGIDGVAIDGRCMSFGLPHEGAMGAGMTEIRNDGDEPLSLRFEPAWRAPGTADDADAPGHLRVDILPDTVTLAPGERAPLRVEIEVLEGAPEEFVAQFALRVLQTDADGVEDTVLFTVRAHAPSGPDPYCHGPMDPNPRTTRTPVDERHEVVVSEANPVADDAALADDLQLQTAAATNPVNGAAVGLALAAGIVGVALIALRRK